MIDTIIAGTLMTKTEYEAQNLLKRWHLITTSGPISVANPRGLEVSLMLMHLLTAKLDAMTQRLDRLNVIAVNSYAPSPTCDRSGSYEYD